jgi:Raf kinase inhibitor-like YbhB/YbcL family protein
MKIKSNDFNDYYFLPKTCGYRFGNKPPNLHIENVPQDATSLALYVFDSDVIYNEKELTHWLLWNIPVDIGELSVDNLPSGIVQGTNDMGVVGYSGPFLKRDIHHIHFIIFALNSPLDLNSTSTRKAFDDAINANFIEHASLIGMFQEN